MLKIISRPVSKLFNKLGYTVTPSYYMIPPVKEKKWIQKLNISTIIDIGSNEGQFIKKISSVLPKTQIFAFEPLLSCYNRLLSAKLNNVTAFNVGLSDSSGKTQINVSNNKESSSILEMKDLHTSTFVESKFVGKETIELKRLDEVLNLSQLQKNILIKLDVQGYEKKVIAGGETIFLSASVLIVETIFEPFYEDQWLFDDIYRYFTENNFKFMGFAEQAYSPKTGIPLFADAIFVKRDLIQNLF